jgi:ribosome-associated protein
MSSEGSMPDRQPAPDGESAEPTESPRSQESQRSQELLREIARYAADKKAGDVVELDLRDVLGYTDWFLICTGNTERQTKAIHDGILEGCKREHSTLPRRVEGFSRGDWILMDYLDVVVHIFTPATREYYRLEQLWGEVPARRAAGGEA